MGYQPTALDAREIRNPYFSDVQKDYVYKANIIVFEHNFGGILVLKKLANQTHRIAFTTELGNTIFDFTLSATDFKVNRILKEMDRKILLSILEQDFRSLIQEEIEPLNTYTKDDSELTKAKIGSKTHFYTYKNDILTNITRVGNEKEKVVITFSEIDDRVARQIVISHKNMKLTISLQAIK
jgi:hypothetical protein